MKKKIGMGLLTCLMLAGVVGNQVSPVEAAMDGKTDVTVTIKASQPDKQQPGQPPKEEPLQENGAGNNKGKLPQLNEQSASYMSGIGMVSVLFSIGLFLNNRRDSYETL